MAMSFFFSFSDLLTFCWIPVFYINFCMAAPAIAFTAVVILRLRGKAFYQYRISAIAAQADGISGCGSSIVLYSRRDRLCPTGLVTALSVQHL